MPDEPPHPVAAALNDALQRPRGACGAHAVSSDAERRAATHAPTVFLVDDDEHVLHAHARLLRAEGLATATFDSAEAFLARHDPSRHGCLVLDVSLPGLDGLALQGRLLQKRPIPSIVFLTGHGDIPMSVQAIRAGALDFLTKPVAATVLLAAVRAALAHDAQVRRAWTRDESLHHRLANLSGREREILRRLAAGKLNKQIAGDLGIAEVTVKFHRSRLMERMQAKTVAELMHAAARLELLSAMSPHDPAANPF